MKSSNKYKLLLLPVAITFVLLFGVLSVNASASLTLNTLRWNDGTIVNITTKSANDGSLVNISFITIRYSSSATINSTIGNIINISNTTATNFNLGYANFTFSSDIVLVDTVLGSVTGVTTGVGDSGGVALAATTVTVDRSVPQIDGLVNIGSGLGTNLQTITFGVINATVWRLFHNGIVVQSTTVTGDLINTTASQQISLRDSGTYYVEVRDGENTTTSATITYTMGGSLIKSSIVKSERDVVKQKQIEKAKQQKSNKGILLVGVAVVIFIVVGGIILSPKVRRKKQ